MNALLNNLAAAVRRQPRRSAFLALLVVALLVLFMRMRDSGPAPASAAGEITALDTGAGLQAVPDISRGADLALAWRDTPAPHISRNLFVSDLTIPPAAPANAVEALRTEPAEEDGLFWRQLDRALAARADREKYRQSLGEAAVRDTARMVLTSVVLGHDAGTDSHALIGNRLVRVGDSVPGAERGPFAVVAIEQNRVILARDGHRLALVLGRTGGTLLTSR